MDVRTEKSYEVLYGYNKGHLDMNYILDNSAKSMLKFKEWYFYCDCEGERSYLQLIGVGVSRGNSVTDFEML